MCLIVRVRRSFLWCLWFVCVFVSLCVTLVWLGRTWVSSFVCMVVASLFAFLVARLMVCVFVCLHACSWVCVLACLLVSIVCLGYDCLCVCW